MYVCIGTCIHTHLSLCVYIYIYTHMYTYLCTQKSCAGNHRDGNRECHLVSVMQMLRA